LSETPETFDLDAWLSGASRPTRSVRIFQKGAMLAELDELGRKIELAEAVGDEERSLSDESPARLRAKYADLSEQFASSALDVRVHGHDVDETRAIMGERFEKTQHEAISKDLVHDALEFPKMSREQFDVFLSKIGPHQWERLKETYTAACRAEVTPSADFLPHAFTPDDSE
jgi:hypothetical protein